MCDRISKSNRIEMVWAPCKEDNSPVKSGARTESSRNPKKRTTIQAIVRHQTGYGHNWAQGKRCLRQTPVEMHDTGPNPANWLEKVEEEIELSLKMNYNNVYRIH